MKAVIMAGGEGTRLRPLTSVLPKPMVPIMNQPVMEHIIGLVKHHGIEEVVATLAFMPKAIEDYFGDGEEWGTSLAYALEETPLGTAGSVKNAEPLLGSDPFVVISGDALTDIDLSEVIRFHKEKGAAVTIALKRVPNPLEFGVVITDDNGRIDRFLEKPSWGQVFSDTINTGIYVVEHEVLAHIPAETRFDFSSELFPALMKAGYPLYGCVVDGYWCDVGSLESYMQVHRDILDGQANVYIPGVETRPGVWVGEGSKIDPSARIDDKVVVGSNVTVRAGACVGSYSVLGDNCVLGEHANVTHSVAWKDCFFGRQARVSGSVLCRQVDVRTRASIDIGSFIGDEATIGQGARIGANVLVYPYKQIEPAAEVNTSVIWESGSHRGLFGESGLMGLIGVDITPEVALRAAQAFGSLLPKGSHVVVSRDSSRAARMLKRAMVAGLNATGCHVRDLRAASPALTRFTVRDTRCVGGVHVAVSSEDPQSLRIEFFDANGLDIAPWEEKKVERLYFRGEVRRAFFEDAGEIIYPPRSLEYYTAGMTRALDGCFVEGRRWRKVVADLDHGVAAIILPNVASAWRVNLVTLNPFVDAERTSVGMEAADAWLEEMRNTVDVFQSDFGVRFDQGGERILLITPSGRLLDGDTTLHAVVDLWCKTDTEGLPIAVPVTASHVVERLAKASGHEVFRPGTTRRALATLALDGTVGLAGTHTGGFMFSRFLASFDAAMATGLIACMLARADVSLDDIVEELPPFFKREMGLVCPAPRKGAVMRAVSKAASGKEVDVSEGVYAREDDGWALVLPHPNEPLVRVWAEGDDPSALETISARWTEVVQAAIDGE